VTLKDNKLQTRREVIVKILVMAPKHNKQVIVKILKIAPKHKQQLTVNVV
jgi:DNA-directed RNA polymerase subunit F